MHIARCDTVEQFDVAPEASVGEAATGDAAIPASKGDPLSTAALPEPHDPSEPVRGRTQRAVNYARRHAWAIGLALWGAAAAVFAVHATGVGMPDPTRFAMTDSWLIGLGCVGCPLMALRAFARRVNLQVFAAVAVFCVALALLLTVLILAGSLQYDTLNATFALILPEAAAIQAVNAADAEIHARRREGVAYQSAREDGVAAQVDVRYAALASLDRLRQMTPGERAVLIDVIHGIDDEERGEHRLRLVAGDGGFPRRINTAARTGRP